MVHIPILDTLGRSSEEQKLDFNHSETEIADG